MSSEGTPRAKQVIRPAPASKGAEAHAQRQLVVDGVADQVMSISEGASGYAGLSVDPDNQRVNVWWCGSYPQALVDFAASRPESVEVVLHCAAYPLGELMDALHRVMPARLHQQPLLALGVTIHTGEVSVDGSGIAVTYSNRGELTEAEVQQTLQQIASVPVRATIGEPVKPQRPGRRRSLT